MRTRTNGLKIVAYGAIYAIGLNTLAGPIIGGLIFSASVAACIALAEYHKRTR
jgi:hypothetical protein